MSAFAMRFGVSCKPSRVVSSPMQRNSSRTAWVMQSIFFSDVLVSRLRSPRNPSGTSSFVMDAARDYGTLTVSTDHHRRPPPKGYPRVWLDVLVLVLMLVLFVRLHVFHKAL